MGWGPSSHDPGGRKDWDFGLLVLWAWTWEQAGLGWGPHRLTIVGTATGNHKGVSAEGSEPWDAHVAGVCHTQDVGGPRAREGEVVPLLAAVEARLACD